MTASSTFDPVPTLARELRLPERGVATVVELLSTNTVPFVARYRKEATGGLDEVEIRNIQERYLYLGELEERRQVVLESIEEQGKLTPGLRERVLRASTKADLEDLYLPYKPRRRTRGIHAGALATGTESRVDSDHTLLPERWRQEKIPEVFCKHRDRVLVAPLLQVGPDLGLHGRGQQPREPILDGHFQLQTVG